MDLKDDEKSLKFHEHPHITSRYFESNAGHLFVNNVNPFNTVGEHAGHVKGNLITKRKNEEFIDIFDNTPNKKPNTTPSKEFVNEILENYPYINNYPYNNIVNNNYNEHEFMNEEYDEIHEAFLAGNQRPFSQPIVSMSANVFDTQYMSCSRDVPKTTRYDYKVKFDEYNQDNNRHRTYSTNEVVSNPSVDTNGRCEKTTYCRPLLNMYNQEFIYKTMQRNARLQKLVRKLVIAREREKQREAWNNYINDLKNKHRYYSNEPSRISPQYVPGDHNTPEMIDDFYNTRFNWRQSNPCQHLLEDFYGTHNYIPSAAYSRHPRDYDSSIPPDAGSFIYDSNRFCYPTCSQANIQRWNKERQSTNYAYDWRTRPAGRYFRGNTIVVEKERQNLFDRIQGTARPYPYVPTHTHNKKSRSASKPIQTEKPLPLVNEEDDKELNVLKPETIKADKDIYFPYSKEATNGKEPYVDRYDSLKKLSIQEIMELDQSQMNVNVPSRQESLKSQMNANVPSRQESLKSQMDANVSSKRESLKRQVNADISFTQEPTKLDKDVNVPSKQDPIKKIKDLNIPHKIEAFKNRMVEKVRNKQKSSRSEEDEYFKEKFKKVTDNITKLKNKIRQSEEETRLKSLATIEQKIDVLLKSIHSIMIDIKTKKNVLLTRKSAAVSACIVTTSRTNLNSYSSDPYGYNEEYLCAMVQSSSRSLTISEFSPSDLRRHREFSITKMDKILQEEIKKSDRVKRDIEELLNLRNDRDCSVQITFDIPTKEISTEVTDSLSKTRFKSISKTVVEEIPSQGPLDCRHRQMTIAVNTDPLGLLALLRVSTETVKQLLSYVPNLNYNTYLSMLPLPTRQGVSHYICNICGAAFGRPSQLSDHIEQHNLGRRRDCCVCRHMLDLKRTRVGLFACRHCGQRFTRAYCCELHQQTCARQLGRPHDVNSGHMLLR